MNRGGRGKNVFADSKDYEILIVLLQETFSGKPVRTQGFQCRSPSPTSAFHLAEII